MSLFEYRVTKYNPALRTQRGAFVPDHWTSVADVGKFFGGLILTQVAYDTVETAYVEVALAFLHEANVQHLVIRSFVNAANNECVYEEAATLTSVEVAVLMRKVLREELWCRLEGPETFLHFGYDYYMYIGVPCGCPLAHKLASDRGLFTEEMRSPYHPATGES